MANMRQLKEQQICIKTDNQCDKTYKMHFQKTNGTNQFGNGDRQWMPQHAVPAREYKNIKTFRLWRDHKNSDASSKQLNKTRPKTLTKGANAATIYRACSSLSVASAGT
jgi:hypothetical protein